MVKKQTCTINGKKVRICVNCYQVLRRAGLLDKRPYRRQVKAPGRES